MQNTTDVQMLPVGAFPPPPPARLSAPPNQINQAPYLPLVTVAPPTSHFDPPTANQFATSLNPPPSRQQPRRPGGGGVRRFVSWMLVLGVIGGLAYGAIAYGPQLMDRATGEESIDEPSAPLAFPIPTVDAAPIRSASWSVEHADARGATAAYAVTTDYETGVTQVLVDRGDAPDLEILSVFDQSVIRRVDEPHWYSLPRGDVPIDASMGRSRWIRTLDELLPPAVRGFAVIERSTTSVVANEPTRRLLVSIEPTRLTPADPSVPSLLAPGVQLSPDIDTSIPIEIEVWIDDSGIVRKSILPVELGGETITVTSVSADPFETTFPAAEQVRPLATANLLHLGI